MSDALKMLPYDIDQRVRLSLDALGKIHPGVDVEFPDSVRSLALVGART
jgi:hypothetical protein